MLKLIILGGVLHLFFLASIFVIYFQSPIITGLQPQSKIINPPAKRIVLFVADGLRAESFFRKGCALTKFLQNVILTQGIHGISHTRVPTESRPGHVALIAGLYEDPSALFKGWQENPVDFDSVFNRSRTTYAWGSPDILSIFKNKSNNNRNIKTFFYDPSAEDFSGRYSTILLDNWVFDEVEEFLKNHHKQLEIEDETIFFLHLLGLDTAGHVHKPNTKLFQDNLIAVDQGVERITKLFNNLFHDDKTAFIFTADHGMTDRGSHGDGDGYETETPMLAWGAGVAKWTQLTLKTSQMMVTTIGSIDVPRFDVKQADVAPLMSSLLGIPVPVNNHGQLPYEYINSSQVYVATALFNNALQIAEQYKHLRKQFSKGSFSKYLNDFDEFDGNRMTSTEIEINRFLDAEMYNDVIDRSKHFINESLKGIDYFQSYYQHWLLAATSLSMIGWILFLLQIPLNSSATKTHFNFEINKNFSYFATFGTLMILVFIYFQNLALSNAIILGGPLICWLPITWSRIWMLIKNFNVWIFVFVVESLVWTFFYRPILCVHLIALPIYHIIVAVENHFVCQAKWILTSFLLSVFPLFPVVGHNDKHSLEILIFGIILWSIKFCYSLQQKYSFYKICHLLIFAMASMSTLSVALSTGLHTISQITSWICLSLSFILPLLQSTKNRFSKIIDGLCIPFLLLSLSYEPVFLLLLSLNLEYFVGMQSKEGKRTKHLTNSSQRQQQNTFAEAFTFMLYILVSFFGTGNLASISSFDPNSVRCFVAIFSPFVMTALLILKIVIPLMLVVCAFTAIYASHKLPMNDIFIAILVLCNIMGINFLFLVTNKGSWLQIGTSISHFVIIEVTTVVLCVLQFVAKSFMESEVCLPLTNRRVSTNKCE